MRKLGEFIKQATLHVKQGRRIIAEQRKRIADGSGAPDAVELLKSFEQSQEIFEQDLDRLLKKRDRHSGQT
jgi:hypothetical protein